MWGRLPSTQKSWGRLTFWTYFPLEKLKVVFSWEQWSTPKWVLFPRSASQDDHKELVQGWGLLSNLFQLLIEQAAGINLMQVRNRLGLYLLRACTNFCVDEKTREGLPTSSTLGSASRRGTSRRGTSWGKGKNKRPPWWSLQTARQKSRRWSWPTSVWYSWSFFIFIIFIVVILVKLYKQ